MKKKDKKSDKGRKIKTRKKNESSWIDLISQFGGPVTVALEIVRLTMAGVLMILFTKRAKRVNLHYIEERGIYVHCNGPDCVLCKANYKVYEKILLPVYLVVQKVIAILPISNLKDNKNGRPLLSLILPFLLKAGKGLALVIVKRLSNWDYEVDSLPLSPEIEEDAKLVIEEFEENIDDFDIDSVYAKMSNEELLRIPEVRTKHLALNFNAKAATEVMLEDDSFDEDFDAEDPELEDDWDEDPDSDDESDLEDPDEDSDDDETDLDDLDEDEDPDEDDDLDPDFDDMTKKELLEFAEENDLEIPNLRKMRVAKARKAVKKAWEELLD